MSAPDFGARYEVLGLLGAGAFGRVFRAHDASLGREVAIKEVALAAEHTEVRARLAREARAASAVRHPNLVEVLDTGTCADGTPYLVMELVPGCSLEEVFDEGPVDPERLAAWVRDVASALGALHEGGIVHRDVKPANVLVHADGRAMLTDLGLVRPLEDTVQELTRTGALPGTPLYLPPEVFQGQRKSGPEGDLYALGCVAYRGLYGKNWRDDDDLRDLLASAGDRPEAAPAARFGGHPQWDPWLRRLLHQDPAIRLGPADVIVEEAGYLAEGGAPPRPPRPPPRRARTALAVLGGLALGAVAWKLAIPRPAPDPSPATPGPTASRTTPRAQLFQELVDGLAALPTLDRSGIRRGRRDEVVADFVAQVDVRTPLAYQRTLGKLQEVTTRGPPGRGEPWIDAVYTPLFLFLSDIGELDGPTFSDRLKYAELRGAGADPRVAVTEEVYAMTRRYLQEAARAGRFGRDPREDALLAMMVYRARFDGDAAALGWSMLRGLPGEGDPEWRVELLRNLGRLIRIHLRYGVPIDEAEALAEELLALTEGPLAEGEADPPLSAGELETLAKIDLFLRQRLALRETPTREVTTRGRRLLSRVRARIRRPERRRALAALLAKEMRGGHAVPFGEEGSTPALRALAEEVREIEAWAAASR